ncbi:MAG: 2-hydroxyacid dehydrogenase [Flavobacterium sp.]
MKMKVFATRKIPQSGIAIFEKEGIEMKEWIHEREPDDTEMIENCRDVDGVLLFGRSKVSADFLKASSHLKVISLYSAGFDNVAVPEATKLKIPVGHTPDVLSNATADTAFLLLLATSRKAFFHHKRIKNGEWGFYQPMAHVGTDIHGKTLGIFGLGSIGFEMARMCKAAFGMDIIYHNRSTNERAENELGARKVTFEELLAQSDAISLHANLTPETTGVFGREAFRKMKPTAIFINTARGQMHNEQELTEALQSGEIWGAGLDATNPEPMDSHHPLLDMENVCVLPHIGSAVKETREDMMALAAKNLMAGLKGERLPKCVNPEVYE